MYTNLLQPSGSDILLEKVTVIPFAPLADLIPTFEATRLNGL